MNALIQEKTDKIRTKIPPKRQKKFWCCSFHSHAAAYCNVAPTRAHLESQSTCFLCGQLTTVVRGPSTHLLPPPPLGLRLSILSSAQAEACTYLHTLASEMCPVVSKSLLLQTREAADIWFTPPAAATVLVSLSESDLKRLTRVHLRICVQPQCSLGWTSVDVMVFTWTHIHQARLLYV